MAQDATKYGSSTIQCPTCGTDFKVYNSVLRRKQCKLVFCSKKCFIVHCKKKTGKNNPRWINRPKRFCPVCNVEIDQTVRREQIFCSPECASKHHSKSIQKINNPRWKGGKPVRICQICGRQFKSHISQKHEKKGYGKYCSLKCRGKAELGSNNHAWQGGSSFEPYPLTFNNRFKEMIRSRDIHMCTICGSTGNQVHHIDYNKKNTIPLNCITLCETCHGHTNYNRDYWQSILSEIVSSI